MFWIWLISAFIWGCFSGGLLMGFIEDDSFLGEGVWPTTFAIILIVLGPLGIGLSIIVVEIVDSKWFKKPFVWMWSKWFKKFYSWIT